MSQKNLIIEDDETKNTTGLLRKLKVHEKAIFALSITSNRQNVITGSIDKSIKIFNLKTGKEIRTIKGLEDEITSVCLSTDEKILISATEGKIIKKWDMTTGKLVNDFQGHDGSVFNVCYDSNGKYLLSCSEDKTVKIWDANTNRLIRTLAGHNAPVNAVDISDNGKLIASATEKSIILWKWGQVDPEKTFEGHKFNVTSVAFNPEGKILVSGSIDKTVKMWDVQSGRLIKSFEGHGGSVNSISVSDDGKYIVSGSGDGSIIVWNMEDGRKFGPFKQGAAVKVVKFFPKSHIIVAGDFHGFVKVWDPINEIKALDSIYSNENKVSEVVESENVKISVFISYATIDSKKYDIAGVAHLLRSFIDIKNVLYWEENMKDDIFEYMNDNIKNADVLVLFCSESATNSDAVRQEWMAAYKLKKKIIPVFEREEHIPPLLTTKLGINIKIGNTKKFVEELHGLIIKKITSNRPDS